MWLVGTAPVNGNLPFQLMPGEYIVGRSPTANVIINAPSVSGRHAKLSCHGQSLVVENLRNRHGTFVNDERAGKTSAQVGARLRFGHVLCLLAPAAMYPAGDSDGSWHAIARDTLEELTPAQLEVLRLMLHGLDEATIGKRLGRSGHTIHTHIKAIFKHLGVHSRTELMAKLLSGKSSRRLP